MTISDCIISHDQLFRMTWQSNLTHICFNNVSDYNPSHQLVWQRWCGEKDECSQVALLLPIFNEQTWPSWLRSCISLTVTLTKHLCSG